MPLCRCAQARDLQDEAAAADEIEAEIGLLKGAYRLLAPSLHKYDMASSTNLRKPTPTSANLRQPPSSSANFRQPPPTHHPHCHTPNQHHSTRYDMALYQVNGLLLSTHLVNGDLEQVGRGIFTHLSISMNFQ